MAALLAGLFCVYTGAAAEPAREAHTLTVINYNVAGLPKLFGNSADDVAENQRQIGEILGARAYDIVAVQEDFGYHSSLQKGLDGYAYTTPHTGGVPGGDGLNLWSRYGLYNAARTTWETAYGIIDNGADEMTPKGILYALVELEDGVYLDFYNLHADAYGDTGSTAAREVQFRQLAALLRTQKTDRPVIITGDFNTSLKYGNDSGLYTNLMEPLGLRDAWIELYNGGDYEDFSVYADSAEKWDSIEKFLYRSGGGVELEAAEFAYESLYGEEGEALSDHPAALAVFTYTKTEAFVPNTTALQTAKATPIRQFFRKIGVIVTDLYKIFTHFDELTAYLQG